MLPCLQASQYCTDDPVAYADFSASQAACRSRCQMDRRCRYMSFWSQSNWCRLTTT